MAQTELAVGLRGPHALEARLAFFGQSHLLRYWNELSDPARQRLLERIEGINLPLIARLTAEGGSAQAGAELADRASPPPAIRLGCGARPFTASQARERGAAALRAGKVAVIVVAGGQGTRLGADVPKGMLPLGPVSNRSLFQILFERILAVGRRHGAPIPVYVMTSPATHDPTVAFLEENDRFGLGREEVTLFRQGMMPAVCATSGRILMAGPDSPCLAPDGHGGMLAALASSGGLKQAALRGVEQFFYCQIDNPLAPCCDPELLGCHLLSGSEMSTVAVAKTGPQERMGNIVSIDGRVRILEYTELPPDAAARREADGALRFWAGNTAIHVFDRAFLERAVADADALPYHRATKQTPCLNAEGRLVAPSAPNAIKFERFIFDLLPLARNALVIEGRREEAFAPVKNASGEASDTPESAQRAMMNLHRDWLRRAGARVADDIPVEINPLFALDAEELAAKLPKGLSITAPSYLA